MVMGLGDNRFIGNQASIGIRLSLGERTIVHEPAAIHGARNTRKHADKNAR